MAGNRTFPAGSQPGSILATTRLKEKKCESLTTNGLLKEKSMPIGDIIVLILVVLSVGCVAVAAMRSKRGAS
jgi:hypothetical protein